MTGQPDIRVLAQRLVSVNAGPWLIRVASESFGHSHGALLDEIRKVKNESAPKA